MSSAFLLLLNGAPGVGKSTIARRCADDHPLSLIVDIDTMRMQLGQWQHVEESRTAARNLAVALTRAHLRAGYSVIVPQYVARREFVGRLHHTAIQAEAEFVEVLLTDDPEEIAKRFMRRRLHHAAKGIVHPEGDLSDDAVAIEVRNADLRLRRDATASGVAVISTAGGIDSIYRALRAALPGYD